MTIDPFSLKALTIRQPWADLIIRGMKNVEVREWQVKHRGPFLIHVGQTIDWKAVQALGYDGVEALPRGQILGYAEIHEVFVFDHDKWLKRLREHWVIHPLSVPSYGVVLSNVRPFEKPVRCGGNRSFFTPRPSVLISVAKRLSQLGINVEPTIPRESGTSTGASDAHSGG